MSIYPNDSNNCNDKHSTFNTFFKENHIPPELQTTFLEQAETFIDKDHAQELREELESMIAHKGYTIAIIGVSNAGVHDDEGKNCQAIHICGPTGPLAPSSLEAMITLMSMVFCELTKQIPSEHISEAEVHKLTHDYLLNAVHRGMDKIYQAPHEHNILKLLADMAKTGAFGPEGQAAGEVLQHKLGQRDPITGIRQGAPFPETPQFPDELNDPDHQPFEFEIAKPGVGEEHPPEA